jgi:hypothetical protein
LYLKFLNCQTESEYFMAGRGFTVKKEWEKPAERTGSMPVPSEMKIGSVDVRPATVLAPMAGVTDTIFRRFIRHASSFTTNLGAPGPEGTWDSNPANVESSVSNTQSGCGLLMTEFTSADGLSRMRA